MGDRERYQPKLPEVKTEEVPEVKKEEVVRCADPMPFKITTRTTPLSAEELTGLDIPECLRRC